LSSFAWRTCVSYAQDDNQIAENYREKLLEAIKQATNFREIESIVPAKMVEWEEELWKN
jgi:tellurite resistance protein